MVKVSQSHLTEDQLRVEFTKRAHARELRVECPGAGATDREIAIVSDYPGEAEVQQRRPLVGPTGVYAATILRSIGVKYSDCFLTNLSKRQPDFDVKTKTRSKIPDDEIDQWATLLQWELEQLPNLKYVLIMGGLALRGLTNETKISDWRGSVRNLRIGDRIVKCVITHNPAYIHTDSRAEPMFKFDIGRFGQVLKGTYKPHLIEPHINPTFDQAMAWIDYFSKTEEPIAFDIETIHQELACVGFADNAHEGYCINLRDRESHRFSSEEEVALLTRLQELFSQPDRRWIAQNGSFDSYFLWFKNRVRVHKVWFDTLLAHHTLFPRMPHGLGFLTSMYTNHPFYKDEGKDWKEGGDINTFWEYNVKDCCITWACHKRMMKELVEHKLDTFFFDHVMRLQPHLVWMTVGGIKMDLSLREEIAAEMIADVQRMKTEFWKLAQELTGESDQYKPNPRSTKQMQELLFERLRLTGHGRSNSKSNRARILSNPETTDSEQRLVRAAEAYIKDAKFLSTSIGVEEDDEGNVTLKDKIDEDGRGRCEYKQYGTQSAPGRLSSSQTLWGSGWNLQNVPKPAYKMFVADEGYMFSYYDLRQAEAKVVAYLWNVRGLKESFHKSETVSGFDLHRGNASRIFKVPYDQVPKEDFNEATKEHTLRYLGKRCVHGLNYRMSPTKLAEVCKIPLPQAYEAYTAYHRAFPEIRKAWASITKEVTSTRQLWTPMGRRLLILERLDDEVLESVVAFKPQSTIGDKVASTIYLCHEHPDWPHDARFMLNIHDACVSMHRPEDKEVVQHIMRTVAETPILIENQEVVIFTDFKSSVPDDKGVHRWSTLK